MGRPGTSDAWRCPLNTEQGRLSLGATRAFGLSDFRTHGEVTGNESKIEKFLMLMGKFGISELSRTGRVALARKPH